jgi:DEAD/DEAH box helicase domain-containing protein
MEAAARSSASRSVPRSSAGQWADECRQHFTSVATLAVLFAVRSAPLFVHAVAETVAQQSGGGRTFDLTTLKALAAVHPSLISWVEEPDPEPEQQQQLAAAAAAAAAAAMATEPAEDCEWAEAEAAWEAECAKADAMGRVAPSPATRIRIVIAFESNGDTGGVKGNATVGAVRARKKPKKAAAAGKKPASAAARWMGAGHDGLASLLNQAQQDFGERCDALARSTPVEKLLPLCAEEAEASAATASDGSEAPATGESHCSWPPGVPVTAGNFLSYVQNVGLGGLQYSGQLVSLDVLPKRERRLAEFPAQLCAPVVQAARTLHHQLYTHQAEAVTSALAGVDTVVTTSTASGKSLIYALTIAEIFNRQPAASTHLLLFPTKALAHDQRLRLETLWGKLAPGLKVAVIDGDTPHAARPALLRECHVLLTSPDLLHYTALPQHASGCWNSFLGRLRVVVIDELHSYHGVFGTHVALVLRRLRRLCAAGPPLFIGCSATLANPEEHFRAMAGLGSQRAVKVVSEDGSPCGRKQFALWNPPIVVDLEDDDNQEDHGHPADSVVSQKASSSREAAAPSSAIGFGAVHGPRRSSSVNEAAALLGLLVTHGIRTIAFVKARNVAELLLRKTRERLPASLQNHVAAYRAGYTSDDRRQIEADLRSGRVTAVVATNALELGVDIGGIVATLHLGFPGSSAALCQQMGRAGRAVEDSLAVMIALDAPLDQSFVAAAAVVASAGGVCNAAQAAAVLRPTAPAHTTTDLSNPALLATHLAMAAAESPLEFGMVADSDDALLFGSSAQAIADRMATNGKLERVPCLEGQPEGRCYAAVSKGARPKVIGLRGMGERTWRVVCHGRVLEEVEEARARETLFPGAVLIHRGQKYIVCEPAGGAGLQLADVEVQVERCSVDYYTEAQAIAEVIGTESAVGVCSRQLVATDNQTGTAVQSCHGAITISKTVHSYRRRRAVDRKIIDSVELFQQPATTQTHAWWLRLPGSIEREVHDRGWSYERGGLHAVEHALIAVAPAFAVLESAELGCQCRRLDMIGPGTKHLLLYEKHQGGVGLAAQLAQRAERVLCAALQLMEGCVCETGCPNCVHMERCEEFNQRLDKPSGIYQLRRILGASEATASLGLSCSAAVGAEPGPPTVGVRGGQKRMRNPLGA